MVHLFSVAEEIIAENKQIQIATNQEKLVEMQVSKSWVCASERICILMWLN